MSNLLPFDTPPMDAPIRFAGATRTPRKGGGWVVMAVVKCAQFVDIEDIFDFMAKQTNISEWVSDEGNWDGTDFIWNLLATMK